MKVKELIEELRRFDNDDLEVYVADEIEGNDSPLSRLEIGYEPQSAAKECLMIRWN